MKKSNYAFVSALYASKTKGLYSDIYFPIIKYALAKIVGARPNGNAYCSADEVSDYINDKFGVRIPTIVIAKSVCKIGNQQDGNLNLIVYEKGNTFQINRAIFYETEVDIEEKERFFSDKLEEIETKYQEFLTQQGCYDDGVTFVQFISDNTDEILGYFENENKNCVGDNYATLIMFLQYVHDTDKWLYSVVHQLFWSSIIVGFLKSEKPLVDDSEKGIKAEYFLDTSIVLGLLDLSTSLKETYSKEVCSVIINSGGVLKINPMTVEEIRGILEKVEQIGPYPLTDIAEAYSKRHLIPNDLAKIRLNLEKILLEKQIDVYPHMSPSAVQKVIREYKGKSVTKLLGEFRCKDPSTYNSENFREIHDVYMDHYIKQRRNEKGLNDSTYFLTDNVDLVKFCYAQHEGTNYMLSTGKVVLDLWMHNKQQIDVSDCVLTETMARCLGLHKSNVRYKIMEVSRYYNKTKNDFDPQVYKDFVGHLYRRAKNVIAATKQFIGDNVLPQPFTNLIKEAVEKDNEAYHNSLAQATKDKTDLKKKFEQKEKQVEEIQGAIDDLQGKVKETNKHIENLESEKSELADALQQHKENLKLKDKELNQIQQDKANANRKIALLEERDKIKEKKTILEDELRILESKRKKVFKNRGPLYCKIGGSVTLFVTVVMVIAVISGLLKWGMLTIAGMIFTATLFLFKRKFALDDHETERAQKAYDKWQTKNPRYSSLIQERQKLDERLKEINAELKN